MARHTLPNIGLVGGFMPDEDGWDQDMNLNLLRLSVLGQASALAFLSALPGAPKEGDVYVLKADAGEHAGQIAVYDEGAWKYIDPVKGWLVYDQATGVYMSCQPPAAVPNNRSYWRLRFATNNGDNFLGVSELDFYDLNGAEIATTGGTSFSSSGSGSEAFDGNPATSWSMYGNPVNGRFIGYQFASPVKVGSVKITGTDYIKQALKDGSVQWSSDGVNYTDRFTISNQTEWANREARTFVDPAPDQGDAVGFDWVTLKSLLGL